MHLHYTDRHRRAPEVETELGLTWHDSREEIFGVCDVVTLNVPLHSENEHMINDETLKRFKRGANLVSTARGKLADCKDRKRVVLEKRVTVRVDLGGRRLLNKYMLLTRIQPRITLYK